MERGCKIAIVFLVVAVGAIWFFNSTNITGKVIDAKNFPPLNVLSVGYNDSDCGGKNVGTNRASAPYAWETSAFHISGSNFNCDFASPIFQSYVHDGLELREDEIVSTALYGGGWVSLQSRDDSAKIIDFDSSNASPSWSQWIIFIPKEDKPIRIKLSPI